MENANTRDYVTEKVYDALAAGCVPIYMGAANIASYIPQTDGILNVADYNSTAALVAELEHLARDRTAYEAKLAWKSKTFAEMTPGDVVTLIASCLFCLPKLFGASDL